MEKERDHLEYFVKWLRSKTGGVIFVYLVLALLSILLLQQHGTNYLDKALLKASASYAVARGLNGIITVIMDSSITAGFVVEGNIAIGQILDPINDLVERFSLVMLISIVSLGIQKILMGIGVKVGIGLFLIAVVILVIGKRTVIGQTLGYKFLLFAIMIQAAIPITTTVGSFISTVFLQKQYKQSEEAITKVQQEIQNEYAIGSEGQGTEKQAKWYEKYDPRKIIQNVKERAVALTDHIVNLIIVFIFETMVLPLLTLWGWLQVLKMLIGKG